MSKPTIVTAWDEHFMLPDFMGCVHWAIGDEKTLAAYRKTTGDEWTPGKTPVGRMIDQATGADREFLQRFSDWVADNLFGRPEDLDKPEDEVAE
ncbi:MAG TPA: hypothetical protein VGN93_13335 [Shinella sp.]|jgi:hypothetical protein|uniref:hypothetical protein n=1 Tax=Shinella sp. TaxID=1870904 RepID=UPI002E109BED|nr:hypothetical protein [Shinella sp.]